MACVVTQTRGACSLWGKSNSLVHMRIVCWDWGCSSHEALGLIPSIAQSWRYSVTHPAVYSKEGIVLGSAAIAKFENALGYHALDACTIPRTWFWHLLPLPVRKWGPKKMVSFRTPCCLPARKKTDCFEYNLCSDVLFSRRGLDKTAAPIHGVTSDWHVVSFQKV